MSQGKENKPHIAIFGRCNAGKSTLLNFITGADTAIVSPQSGTTTDPVRKSYEILGFSPVILIDTPGIDDPTCLGAKRISRTEEAVRETDLALLVFRQWGEPEQQLADLFNRENVPCITVLNLDGTQSAQPAADIALNLLDGSPEGHEALIALIRSRLPERSREAVRMFGGMLSPGDQVLLVCPIDGGAPAGRMILPQVQALREVLDADAIAHVVQPSQVGRFMACGITPKMVVTDSQVYKEIRAAVPAAIEVTTFSILLAAAKGDYALYTEGLKRLDSLRDGDRILVSEFCSHQTSCDDIARVKIPGWMEARTGRKLSYTYVSAGEPLPADASSYALMLMCGGCMATRTRIQRRLAQARELGLPVTNFGLLIRRIR